MDEQHLQKTLEQHFIWLHRHPELSYAEHKTSAFIRAELERRQITVLKTALKTGLVAQIEGAVPAGSAAPVVALRADIDAIPVTEASDLAYASENPGVMHACGHDYHTAALLGAAFLLKAEQERLRGNVLLIFQPAEEVSGGAASVLAAGALENVREIYGLHCAPDYESGVIALKAGGTFAAVIAFKIKIEGKGGHAAIPQDNRDPVVAAAALISAAQTIVSRNTSPFDPVVLSFTHIEAGKTWNVIPGEAFVEGTIRALSADKAKVTAGRLKDVCEGIQRIYQTSIDVDWWMDAPATNNDAKLTAFAAETARGLGLPVTEYQPTMAGEDFALYQERIPGVFINFGVGSPHGLHHPAFCARTTHLGAAARFLAALASGALERLAEEDPNGTA